MDIDELIRKAKDYTTIDEEKVKQAFHFAEMAHAGQMRVSGEPYITHPFAVAMSLTEQHADEESLIAALLHDVVEDTDHELKEIEEKFGKPVAKMVDSLTKLPHVNSRHVKKLHQFDSKIESIRKIFEIMQEDVRVIVIKLCDRLHNMETLGLFPLQKQKRIAQETLDIFVRISDRLCIGELKERLEELSFQFLHPEMNRIQKKNEAEALRLFKKSHKRIEKKLHDLPGSDHRQHFFRTKPVYPESKHFSYQNAETVNEIVVIVERDEDCFSTLLELHEAWEEIVGSFRDYVTFPRSNGYQALWTSVMDSKNVPVRFVIQTEKMSHYARKGVTADCFLASGTGKKIRFPWVVQLKKIHRDTKNRSKDYLSALEKNILFSPTKE